MPVAQVLLGHAQQQAPRGGRPLRAAPVRLHLLRQLQLQQQPLQRAYPTVTNCDNRMMKTSWRL